MKVKVESGACIGCGACQAICGDVFELTDEGYAKAKNSEVKEENQKDVLDACEGCPTGAIEVDE